MKKMVVIAMMALVSQLFAEVVTFTKNVPVIRSIETSRYVVERRPIEECWNEEVPVEDRSDVVGAIIGGAAGGIIGHQIGKGSGKTAATIGGAVLGTIVGKNIAERDARPGYRIIKRCRTRYEERERRVVEYKNYARVMGRQIVKYSDRPLRTIPVKVTIEY